MRGNCVVNNASVASAKGISGGFVGFTEGVEKYDGLSGLTGAVVKVLAALLNIVPGVGLGDLITILLQNDVPLGQLIRYRLSQSCDYRLQRDLSKRNNRQYWSGL